MLLVQVQSGEQIRGVAGLAHRSDGSVSDYSLHRIAGRGRRVVGSKGDSYDSAIAEAFNSLFKAECIRNPSMRPNGDQRYRQNTALTGAETN